MPSVARFLLGLLLGAVLLSVVPQARAQSSSTPQCFINGGSVYPGCVPAKMVFRIDSAGETQVFASLEAGIMAAMARIIPRCPNYGYNCKGIYRSPITYAGRNGSNQCTQQTTYGMLPSLTRGTDSNYLISYQFLMYYERFPGTVKCTSGGKLQDATEFGAGHTGNVWGAAVCPTSYTRVLEFPNQWSGNYGYFCAPPRSYGNLSSTQSALRSTCQDGDRQTCGEAGNPIDLASDRRKVESDTDLIVPGDFPIRWVRTYKGNSPNEGLNPWKFLSVKSAEVAEEAASGVWWASLDRGDGTRLAYKGSGVAGARTWMAEWGNTGSSFRYLVKSHLSDWEEEGQLKGVVLRNNLGEKEFYGMSGRLEIVENTQGKRHFYRYNSDGLLTKVEQEGGRFISVEWEVMPSPEMSSSVSFEEQSEDGSGVPQTASFSYYQNLPSRNDLFYMPVVKSVSDGLRTIRYSWSHSYTSRSPSYFPLLVSVEMASSRVWGYDYYPGIAASNFLRGKVDPEGKTIASYVYSGVNSVGEEWRGPYSASNETKIDWLRVNGSGVRDAFENLYQVSANQGRMASYTTDCPVCRGTKAKSFTYNAANQLAQVTDFNNIQTSYTYDFAGYMASKTEGVGTALARTTSYTWMAGYNLPLTVTEPVVVGNAAGQRVTTYTYNAQRQPLTQTVSAPDGAGGTSTRTTTYAYDTNGRLATVTDPQGRVIALYYNGYGDLVARVENPGTPAERTTRWGGYLEDGLARWSLSQEGLATLAEWDLDGNLLETRQGLVAGAPADLMLGASSWSPALPTTGIRLMGYAYNAVGLLERTDEVDGTYTQLVYDHVNRLTAIKRFGVDDALVSTTELTLDRMSNVTAVTVKDGAGQIVQKSGAVYDAQYRVSKLLNAAGEILWSQSFDAMHNPLSKVDALQRTSSAQFDALGRSFKQIDANNKAFTVSYGPQDEIRTATDARGVVTAYAYNGFGELVSLVSPDRGTWAFAYDAAGRQTTTTDPRGVVVTTSYDALSRPVTRQFSDAGVASTAVGFEPGVVLQTFAYDTCTNGRGRLCSFTDSSGQTAYAYNAWGERTGKAWTGKAGGPAAGVTLSTGYGFEAATGRLITLTLPSGKLIHVTHGADGQPSSVDYDGRSVVAQVRWTALDAVAGWAWPQAVGWGGVHDDVSFTYDLDGRPVAIADLDQRSLVWDAGDRLVGVDDANDAASSQVYGYDAVDRLTSADIGFWNGPLGFTYDAVGNRTALTGGEAGDAWQYTYGLTNNRLTTQTAVTNGEPGQTFTASYDAMGNLVGDGIGLQLRYDATGRLVQGSKGPQSMTAAYNALGQRMVKASGSEVRVYAVDEAGRPLGVYVVDAAQPNGYRVEEEYVHLDGWRPVAVVRPDATTGMANPQIFPILTDHLGTPRKVLDGNTGDTRWSWDAKQPFGHEMPNETPTAGQAAFAFDLRFPGQRYDEETGLFHNGFRDYHSGLGRYVQSDPLGLEAGWNTFSYGAGNPTGNIDPLGQDWMNDISTFLYNVDGAIVDSMAYLKMPSLPQSTVDFTTGAGDSASFGLTLWVRNDLGTNSFVNRTSCAYEYGSVFGGILGAAGTGLGAGGTMINRGLYFLTRASGKSFRHYTTKETASIISKTGTLLPSRTGLLGKGVYVTNMSPRAAKILGAKKTEAYIPIDPTKYKVVPTPMPGNFVIRTKNGVNL